MRDGPHTKRISRRGNGTCTSMAEPKLTNDAFLPEGGWLAPDLRMCEGESGGRGCVRERAGGEGVRERARAKSESEERERRARASAGVGWP